MFPVAVVKHFDVIDHVGFGLLPRGIAIMIRPLARQAAKESFHHRIVQTVPFAAHTTPHAVHGQELLIGLTGILTPPVRMVQQAYRWPPPPDGHLLCFLFGVQPAIAWKRGRVVFHERLFPPTEHVEMNPKISGGL
jgi:hypothetical protein